MFDTIKYNFIAGIFRKAPFIVSRKLSPEESSAFYRGEIKDLVVEINESQELLTSPVIIASPYYSQYKLSKSLYFVDSVATSNFINLLKIKKFLLENFSDFIFSECSGEKNNSFARVLIKAQKLKKNFVYYTNTLQPVFFLRNLKQGKCRVKTADFKVLSLDKSQLYTATNIIF